MLQRIQSFWMALAVACAALTLKFSFFSGNKPSTAASTVPVTTTFEYLTATSNLILLILTVGIIVAGAINIFNYKNRTLQARINLILIVVSLLDIFLYYQATHKFVQGNYDLTALFSLGIPVFFIFAARGISRDNKLIKSADKLR